MRGNVRKEGKLEREKGEGGEVRVEKSEGRGSKRGEMKEIEAWVGKKGK